MRKLFLLILIFAMPFATFAQDDPLDLACDAAGVSLEAEVGDSYIATCPADCGGGSVWGTDIYTDDSNICNAAVHAGVIEQDEGGEFVIHFIDGQEEYEASDQNGVSTSTWGSWDISFTFDLPAIEIDWNTRGYDLEGEDGDEFLVACPEDGEANSLWGTEVYTDDSSICTAAVHTGLIDFEEGGEVLVTFIETDEEHPGSEQNDIESSDWGTWDTSFSLSLDDEVLEIDWNTRGYDLEGEDGDEFVVLCPEDGEANSLWGTEVYTDDSSICTAAAHMGLIDFEDGGEVLVTFIETDEEHPGSEQNDVDSSDWGTWDISFSVATEK